MKKIKGLRAENTQNDIAEIKLRAERRIGEFSRELPAIGHRPKASHDGELIIPKTSILSEAGITHCERYEAIASLPDDIFERIQYLLFWI